MSELASDTLSETLLMESVPSGSNNADPGATVSKVNTSIKHNIGYNFIKL